LGEINYKFQETNKGAKTVKNDSKTGLNQVILTSFSVENQLKKLIFTFK